MKLLSTQPYKGSRDFYPEEMRSRTWFFNKISQTVELFGYEKIDAPILEPIDIYLAKTSEEIVNQQIYSFTDRGDRKVVIRPEMTPTVSRMVAGKIRELAKPIRWYSLPNLWRYERPGKGRLREHWQLNCDLFSVADEKQGDIEILTLAIEVLKAFDATEKNFQVYINHREILNTLFSEILKLSKEQWPDVARIMDKKSKIPKEAYIEMLKNLNLADVQISQIDDYLENGLSFLQKNSNFFDSKGGSYIQEILSSMSQLGYEKYITYNPSIVRGFDYYTGLVFEIFDIHPDNNRSLYGGGRYDNLISNFTKDTANAVGFGMGDVTLVNFLKTHNLYKTFNKNTKVYIVYFPEEELKINANQLAQKLRSNHIATEVSTGPVKLAKQFNEADSKNIPIVLIQGSQEKEKNIILLKNLESGEQIEINENELIAKINTLISI